MKKFSVFGFVLAAFSICNLSGLNADNRSVKLVLDDLDFHDLQNMALTDREFAELAAFALKRQVSASTVEIVVDREESRKLEVDDMVSRAPNRFWLEVTDFYFFNTNALYLEKLRLVFNVLYHFGDAIKTLKIFPTTNEHNARQIYKLVNDRCSESLVDFTMYISGAAVGLEELKRPFKAVKELFFSGSNIDVNGTIPLNHTFPELQTFTLQFFGSAKFNKIACHFPKLENLKVRTSDSGDGTNQSESNVEKLIRLNPQIKHVDIELQYSLTLMKCIAEHLKALDTIKIYFMSELNELPPREIHFGRVKKLDVFGFIDGYDKVYFEHLEEIEFHRNVSIGILERNSGVRCLKVHNLLSGSASKLLAMKFPNLEEMKILIRENNQNVQVEPSTNVYIEFIERNRKLKKFEFECGLTKEALPAFKEALGLKWNITFVPTSYELSGDYNFLTMEAL